jgi:hypothetical protein
MNTYIGTKIVRATLMDRGAYNALRGWTVPADENPADEGYLVEYTDGGKPNHKDFKGYISWSPKAQFENAYRNTTGLTFGMAIEALKKGLKVSRAGWNGKGMYLWLMPAAMVKVEWCKEPHLKALAEANGGEIEALGTIRMFTVNAHGRKAVLTGWLASQTDMLSEDWEIV